MYWDRLIKNIFCLAAQHFPAVLITGCRQSGKTTFLQHEGREYDYVSFDDLQVRMFANQDPNGFLDQYKKRPVILDEVQNVPTLFSYLKLRIDADRDVCGRYLMTGSQQFHMMKHISDSLAGRVAILELLPLAFSEIPDGRSEPIEQLIWNGGYPSIWQNQDARDLWMSAYIQTYLERDVRQLQQIRNLSHFEQYIGLCAAHHGQLVNRATIASAIGIAQPTVKEWESVLTASYITYLLQPYYENFGKRLTKSPKMYFMDSGVAAWLSRQTSAEAMWRGAGGGAFFEGWIVTETYKTFTSAGQRAPIYYWRSHDGLEVDLIIQIGHRLHAIEIKQSATPTYHHGDALVKWRSVVGDEKAGDLLVVCTCRESCELGRGVKALPWSDYLEWLQVIIKKGN